MRVEDAVHRRFDVVQKTGDEWLVHCPDPKHLDRNPSASINIRKAVWTCYACGSGGRVQDLFEDEEITEEPDLELLLEEISKTLENLDQPAVWSQWDNYPESWLKRFYNEAADQYWRAERGFSTGTISHFNLGFDLMTSQPVYPVRNASGGLLGVVRRNQNHLIGKVRVRSGKFIKIPKYEYPKGVDMASCLFGIEWFQSAMVPELWIAEGALDAMALTEAGLDAVGQYGIRLHQNQAQLIKTIWPTRLIFCYDMDVDGQKSLRKQLLGYRDNRGRWVPPITDSYALQGCLVLAVRWDPGHGKDPLEAKHVFETGKYVLYKPTKQDPPRLC